MQWLREYFNFSRGEYLGFILLAAILLILCLLPGLIAYLNEPKVVQEKKRFQRELQQFIASRKKHDKEKENKVESGKNKSDEPVYFEFNPNEIGYEKWLELGLSRKLAHTIENYKKAGGKFYKKTDVKTIYGFTDSIYQKLAPYIDLPESKQNQSANKDSLNDGKNNFKSKADTKGTKNVETKVKVTLNQADTSELKKVYGIGDFFARKIVEKRENLGGFYRMKQLKTIYGMDSSNFERVVPQLILDTSHIKPLSLSENTFKEFLKHPYFDYPDVKAIFDYKEKHGEISSVKKLKTKKIIGAKLYSKVKPYVVP